MAETVSTFADARSAVAAWLGGAADLSDRGAQDGGGWLVTHKPSELPLNEPLYLVDRGGGVQSVHMNDIEQDVYDRIMAMAPVQLT